MFNSLEYNKTILNNKQFNNTISLNNNIAEIYIYGEIVMEDWDTNSPNGILWQLESAGNIQEINLYINSCGGSIAAGWNICNIINRKRKNGVKCNVYVDGFACSIASVIALYVADKLYMYENSLLMVHLPLTSISGNKNDFKKGIEDLEKMEEQLKGIYKSIAKETLTDEILDKMLEEETWLNAQDVELYFDIEIERKNVIYNKTMLEIDQYKNIKNLPKEKYTFVYNNAVENLNKKIAELRLKEINNFLNSIEG